MNLFVIHSSVDREEVENHISELKRKTYNLNTLLLSNGGVFWKTEARNKIKKSQMVLLFIGEKTHQSPYIGWEISQAIKYKKPIYTLKLNENNMQHDSTVIYDEFSEVQSRYDKVVSLSDLSDIINKHKNGAYNIFNQTTEEMDKNALLEQYKVFLQTSEDLVLRRQNVNSFYISISSALIALFSALFAFDIRDEYRIIIGILFSLVGIILSISWIKMLAAYGNLNSSKMKIISGIEKELPASLFDAEWEAMSDKLNKKRYVSFTDSEKIVPKLFALIYICIIIALVFSLVIKFLSF